MKITFSGEKWEAGEFLLSALTTKTHKKQRLSAKMVESGICSLLHQIAITVWNDHFAPPSKLGLVYDYSP